MENPHAHLIRHALALLKETGADTVFVFLRSEKDCGWFLRLDLSHDRCVVVLPKDVPRTKDPELKDRGVRIIRSWAGNQSRFSRIKYAFLHGVLNGVISPESKVICVLGPWGTNHLDTLTVHDLARSWTEDFPLDPLSLIAKRGFTTVMAMVDVALDIGAMGREGKSVGTTIVIGDTENVIRLSHQAVFNPFKGYPKRERLITLPEVVESIKELATLDGAIVVSDTGVVEAAGRHLDASSPVTKQLRGLGARHRAAAGISRKTEAVAVVVSESTGKVTVFENGKIIATLEPVISRRLV